MIRTVFHSEDLPAAERLARFDDFLRHCDHPMAVTSSAPELFRATARALEIGPVSVAELTLSPSVVRRVGDVCVRLPQALLPLPRGRTEALLGRRFPCRDGVGVLLTRFLARLTRDTGTFQPYDGPRLGTVLCDLVAALFTRALEAGPAPAPDPHRRALVSRVVAFVQRHLSDPELTPTAVAAAHGISLSHLHRLFQDGGETVGAFIRRQRLERARFDLADPAQGDTPVHAIAARWGFPRATDFARAFRAAYGIPPTDYRRYAGS